MTGRYLEHGEDAGNQTSKHAGEHKRLPPRPSTLLDKMHVVRSVDCRQQLGEDQDNGTQRCRRSIGFIRPQPFKGGGEAESPAVNARGLVGWQPRGLERLRGVM